MINFAGDFFYVINETKILISKNAHKMLTKFINFIKSIKTVKNKNLDITGFYRLYEIYKNYKIVLNTPFKG